MFPFQIGCRAGEGRIRCAFQNRTGKKIVLRAEFLQTHALFVENLIFNARAEPEIPDVFQSGIPPAQFPQQVFQVRIVPDLLIRDLAGGQVKIQTGAEERVELFQAQKPSFEGFRLRRPFRGGKLCVQIRQIVSRVEFHLIGRTPVAEGRKEIGIAFRDFLDAAEEAGNRRGTFPVHGVEIVFQESVRVGVQIPSPFVQNILARAFDYGFTGEIFVEKDAQSEFPVQFSPAFQLLVREVAGNEETASCGVEIVVNAEMPDAGFLPLPHQGLVDAYGFDQDVRFHPDVFRHSRGSFSVGDEGEELARMPFLERLCRLVVEARILIAVFFIFSVAEGTETVSGGIIHAEGQRDHPRIPFEITVRVLHGELEQFRIGETGLPACARTGRRNPPLPVDQRIEFRMRFPVDLRGDDLPEGMGSLASHAVRPGEIRIRRASRQIGCDVRFFKDANVFRQFDRFQFRDDLLRRHSSELPVRREAFQKVVETVPDVAADVQGFPVFAEQKVNSILVRPVHFRGFPRGEKTDHVIVELRVNFPVNGQFLACGASQNVGEKAAAGDVALRIQRKIHPFPVDFNQSVSRFGRQFSRKDGQGRNQSKKREADFHFSFSFQGEVVIFSGRVSVSVPERSCSVYSTR